MLSPEDLAKLHKVDLEILKEVHRICEKHKIRYFLYFGTLLGAVRHNGFIPWDDDADIVIFYEDCKRFLTACRKDLSDRYSLKVERYDYSATIVADNTKVVDKMGHVGKISIDIFFVDPLPDNRVLRGLVLLLNTFFQTIYRQKYNKKTVEYSTTLGKIFSPTVFILSFFPYSFLRCMFKAFTYFKYISTKKRYFHYSFIPARILKNPTDFSIDYSLKLCLHKFEDTNLYIPIDYHQYLTMLYGDYMIPPPDIQVDDTDDWDNCNTGRSGHGFVSIDIEN